MEERGDRYIHKRFCPYTNEMNFFFFSKVKGTNATFE